MCINLERLHAIFQNVCTKVLDYAVRDAIAFPPLAASSPENHRPTTVCDHIALRASQKSKVKS
ncbi:MAG: hypothetical protein ACLGGO_06735 [Coleofasciculus sp.]